MLRSHSFYSPLSWTLSTLLVGAHPAFAQDQAPPASGWKDLGRASTEVIEQADSRWALLIGVDEYSDQEIVDLRYPAVDARALAEALISSGAYPSNQVIVMTPDQPDLRLRPTRGNILAQLRRLQDVGEADTALVYFSGHGAASPTGANKENFVFPMDTVLSVPSETAISVEQILSMVDNLSHFERRIVMFDACRAQLARAQKSTAPTMEAPRYAEARGTQVLYSTAFGEYSYEDPELGMGAFTYHLVAALDGAADGLGDEGPDGVVSMNEAYRYVDRELKRRTPPQVVWRSGESVGDFAMVPALHIPGGLVDSLPVLCPTTDAEVGERARAALSAFGAEVDWEFWQAYEMAEKAWTCSAEPISQSTALAIHRLEAIRAFQTKDYAQSLISMAAMHTIAPGVSLLEGVPQRPEELDALARLALERPPSRAEAVPVPKGVTLAFDGGPSSLRPTDQSSLVQAINWDGSVQWTSYVGPGAPLPDITMPPMNQRIHNLTLGFKVGLGTAALATTALALGAASSEQKFQEMEGLIQQNQAPSDAEQQLLQLQRQSNGLALAAQAAGATTLGLGASTLILEWRF